MASSSSSDDVAPLVSVALPFSVNVQSHAGYASSASAIGSVPAFRMLMPVSGVPGGAADGIRGREVEARGVLTPDGATSLDVVVAVAGNMYDRVRYAR